MKYGLLIQGPLLSVGRTGANGHKTLDDNSVVRFDCRKTIHDSISEYGHLFSEIVVCTWDDGVFPDFDIEKGRLFRMPDKAKKIRDKRVRRGWVNGDIANNMLKQYSGIHQGLLKFDDAEYIVKIRTDQYLDLDLFVKSLSDLNRIYVPYVIRGRSFIPDFYFAARRDTLIDLFGTLSKPGHITESPHQDIVLRYALSKYAQVIGVDEGWYNQYPTSQQSKIFAYMLNNVFSALPRGIYESVAWRGEVFCEEYRKTFDNLCFGRPDIHPHESLHLGIENALFRSRKGLVAHSMQNALLFIFRSAAYIYNRIFR